MKISDKSLIYQWAKTNRKKISVTIQDESLRDGLQASYVRDPTVDEKIKLVHLMEKIGIHGADIGFPATSKKNFNDVVAIGKYKIKNKLKINLSCAARTVISDIKPIVDASEKIGLALEADIFIGSSQIRRLVEKWDLAKMRRLVKESVSFSVKNNLPVMFVTEDTTRARSTVIKELYKTALDFGAKRICITDTVGYGSPDGVSNLLDYIFKEIIADYKNVEVDWHGHNDRGLEVANSIIAVKHGVNRIHGTALGVGERSGNTPMHKLLVNLDIEGYISGVNLSVLPEYSKFASKVIGVRIPINEPIIGDEAFTTASGVHAAATVKALKDIPTSAGNIYSGVDPFKIGRNVDIQIGPMSGRANVEWILTKLNIKITKSLVAKLLSYVKKKDKVLSSREVKLFLKKLTLKKE